MTWKKLAVYKLMVKDKSSLVYMPKKNWKYKSNSIISSMNCRETKRLVLPKASFSTLLTLSSQEELLFPGVLFTHLWQLFNSLGTAWNKRQQLFRELPAYLAKFLNVMLSRFSDILGIFLTVCPYFYLFQINTPLSTMVL